MKCILKKPTTSRTSPKASLPQRSKIAFKANKKSKNKQVVVESSSEEEGEEEE
jgi:hypothetical protein